MTALQKLLLEELDETESDTFALSDSLLYFGFDGLEAASYQDIANRNAFGKNGKGRNRV